MSEPFLGQIMMVGFSWAPRGWAQCDGQLLPIDQHQALYSLLGPTYGGDGRTTFALPDLRGRGPMHVSSTHPWGQKAGEEDVTLTAGQIPPHSHDLIAQDIAADSSNPSGRSLGRGMGGRTGTPISYAPKGDLRALDFDTVGWTGGQRHNNMQPYLTINFVIAIQGLYPSRP